MSRVVTCGSGSRTRHRACRMYRRTILALTICPRAGPSGDSGAAAPRGGGLRARCSPCRAAADPRGRAVRRRASRRRPRACRAGSPYTLMQMNLCLSGFAGCYGKVAYPAGVDEAVARIRAARPDAVTVNEACRGDVVRIARRTGYHVRFSRVFYLGRPLPCVRPGGRGLFGDAVLTKAAIERTDSHDFEGQSGPRAAAVAVRHHPSGRRRVHRPPEHPLDRRGGRQRRAVRRARGAARPSRGRAHRHLRR